jgi:hypothetical protein
VKLCQRIDHFATGNTRFVDFAPVQLGLSFTSGITIYEPLWGSSNQNSNITRINPKHQKSVKNKHIIQRGNAMLPTLQEIAAFFTNHGFEMNLGRHSTNPTPNADRTTFLITSNRNGYKFHWLTDREDRASFEARFPAIQKLYPAARITIGGKEGLIRRIWIDVDQTNPLEDSLDIVKKTRSVMGYTG